MCIILRISNSTSGEFYLCKPFLVQEPVLRATLYLPDIVKLQHSLFNLFHRRVGKENAKDQTIGSFFKGIKSGKSCIIQWNLS